MENWCKKFSWIWSRLRGCSSCWINWTKRRRGKSTKRSRKEIRGWTSSKSRGRCKIKRTISSTRGWRRDWGALWRRNSFNRGKNTVKEKRSILRRCISCRKIFDRVKLLKITNEKKSGIFINSGIGRSAYICKTKKEKNLK